MAQSLLEELAFRLGVEIRYDSFPREACGPAGGLCCLRGKSIVIVDKNAPLPEQVSVLFDAMARFDLDATWVPPMLRREINRRRSR